MKTAGVVFDFYDDPTGTVLKRVFPTADELPEQIKIAHILSPEERGVLRDDAYALVMVNEGKMLRKFACVDAGNTLLSALYFDAVKDTLPEEAQKIASVNISQKLVEFGLVSKEKTAAASGRGRTRDPMKQPFVGDESEWSQRTNLHTPVQGSNDSSKIMQTTEQMTKNAGARVVDVSGHEVAPRFEKKASQHTALDGKYPLDSFNDVVKAVEYFYWNSSEMTPEDRHTYAVKTAARADALGIPVPDSLAAYGGTDYGSFVHAHMANRMSAALEKRASATTEEEKSVAEDIYLTYKDLREKQASINAEEFAKLLGEVDELAGFNWEYGSRLADPYFATFSGYTTEKAKQASWTWQSRVGTHVTAEQLHKLSKNRELLTKSFSSDIVNGFCSEPIAIFESMPDDTKEVLARLAISNSEGA